MPLVAVQRYILETPRLRLREFADEDLDELAAMVGDAEQMRFYPRTRSRSDAAAWIVRNLRFYTQSGYGFWLIEGRAPPRFLGYCGIRPLELAGASTTEIGWHTTKTAWNRGIATEAAVAVRDAAFDRFERTELVALVPPHNLASRRVAEKIGMREEAQSVVEGVTYATYVCERAS